MLVMTDAGAGVAEMAMAEALIKYKPSVKGRAPNWSSSIC